MKATDYLKTQHKEAMALFDQLEEATRANQREGLRTKLADALSAHMDIEEKIFYPAVKEVIDEKQKIDESFEEHLMAKVALSRLVQTPAQDEVFNVRVKVLRELIEHHVEEEEKELFPEVNRRIDREQSNELTQRLEAQHEEAMGEGHAALLGELLPTGSKRRASSKNGARAKSRSRQGARSEAR